jgi:hypothetical protein
MDDFTGTALGSTWAPTSWTSAGGGTASVTVSGSILSVAGSEVRSKALPLGTGIEGCVNFAAAPYQHFGLATDFGAVNGNYWAVFSTSNTNNTLFARVNASGATTDVNLGALPVGFHTYRVQPVAGGFQFSVDGVLKTTIAAAFGNTTALNIALSSFNGSNPALQADWVREDLYPLSGTFTSAVFDAMKTATWGTVNWTSSLPTGTTIIVQTRSGNTATPDGTWSAWTTVSKGGAVSSPSGRYLQYQVLLTTTDPTQTPVFLDLSVNWS